MSGVLGAFTIGQDRPGDDLLQRMLGAMRPRGSDISAIWRRDGEGAALAVARNAWERAPEFSGETLVLWDGDVTVAADASLYYRDDLERRLGRAAGGGNTPSHLILAAYRRWGERCLRYLEGDYAFVLWDRTARRAFCARDFAGSRPLFYAEVGGTLFVASTIAALRAHPACSATLNHAVLAETAANLWQSPHETPYAAITAIPAGFSLSWSGAGTVSLAQHWDPPVHSPRRTSPLADAAVELRDRVIRAVEARLAPSQVSSVWMSGGRDSTAVFGGGQHALRLRNAGTLLPVSVSYPPGDAGREDEAIGAVADHWGVPIHWLDSRQIPLFDRPQDGAARRDEPYQPPYEIFNRALARGSRAVGARVALDGWGGDQLFTMTPVYLADLFRTGRWIALAREWRALQVRDFRYFFRMAITPTLPPLLREAATLLRGGRPLPGEFDGWMPDWVRPEWVETLSERQRQHMPARRDRSFTDHELYAFLTSAGVARVRGWLSSMALEEGVEARSPLYDARVIELAIGRPRSERRSGRETKLLLRRAMRDLLPEQVLAPRRMRTGVMDDYFRRAMQTAYPSLLAELLGSSPILADLGIIEPDALRRTADACLTRAWNEQIAMALLFTLQAELWLRARAQTATDTHTDGRSLAVLPPGEWPGFIQHHGGAGCTSNRSSNASEPSGSSP
jgi:asparagine synthase (glutamine-hydrolysing)